jgi:hypothetical protein
MLIFTKETAMTLKSKFACAAVAAAMAFSSSAASATTIPVVKNGTSNWTQQPGAGRFIDTFTFLFPNAGRITLTLMSTDSGGQTNVNFNATNVRFDGVIVPHLQRGVFELRKLVGHDVNNGTSSLVVHGSAQALGQYTGSLTYTVPEPAMWAMMILGMGAVGTALRVRRRKYAVAFAM